MLKKSWIFLGALIIIVAAGFLYTNNYQTQEQITQAEGTNQEALNTHPPITETPIIETPVTETPVPETPEVKEFFITAKQFEFIPETITVNQGDQVKLTITSTDVTHGFFIGQYSINERLEPGKTVTVEFIADKKGEFSMVCNVPCGSGHGSMRGKLVVN